MSVLREISLFQSGVVSFLRESSLFQSRVVSVVRKSSLFQIRVVGSEVVFTVSERSCVSSEGESQCQLQEHPSDTG